MLRHGDINVIFSSYFVHFMIYALRVFWFYCGMISAARGYPVQTLKVNIFLLYENYQDYFHLSQQLVEGWSRVGDRMYMVYSTLILVWVELYSITDVMISNKSVAFGNATLCYEKSIYDVNNVTDSRSCMINNTSLHGDGESWFPNCRKPEWNSYVRAKT